MLERSKTGIHIPEDVILFLSDADDISLGYNEINFLDKTEFSEGQIGYSIDEDGNSLVTGHEGDWQPGWLVIANDNLGDPIFVDIYKDNYPVFTAIHGEGTWDAVLIASSLKGFKVIIDNLKKMSVNREMPVDLNENPVTNAEADTFLKSITDSNLNINISYWRAFVEE